MDADTITTFGRSPPPGQALDLAQTRDNLGLSSAIELSQAELNQTEARIEQASATYDYQTQYSYRFSWDESTDDAVPERSVAHGDRHQRRHHHPGVTHQIPPIRGSAHSPLKNKKQAPEEQHRSPNVQGRKRRKVFYVGKPAQCTGLDDDCG
jgi:hypothetical protein